MLSELNREFPTWLTIWPRDRLDKLFSSKTIQTGNEGFDKRFNLSSDDEAAALRILSPRPDGADSGAGGFLHRKIRRES